MWQRHSLHRPESPDGPGDSLLETRSSRTPRANPVRFLLRFAPATLALGALGLAHPAWAHVRVEGVVMVGDEPAHGAEVRLVELGMVTHSDDDGRFFFDGIGEVGEFTLHADRGFLSGELRILVPEHTEDETLELPEPLLLEAITAQLHERVTVTASASAVRPFESFGAVESFEGLDLGNESARNLAELLEGTPGVAIRSFGPGSARPVVRGFSGDRVLTMEDGVRTGDLGSQSADHGVPVDPLQAERVEIVRGPATLLYGSNAIGGVVNVISMASHLAHVPGAGFRGHANLDYSTADEGIRGGARVEASGRNWFAWGGGNSNRTSDYDSPAGTVENSGSSMDQGEAGFGVFGDRGWLSASVRIDDSRYGIPFAGEFHGAHGHAEEEHHEEEEEHHEEEGEHHEGEEEEHGHEEEGHEDELFVDVTMERRQFRADAGLRDLGMWFDQAEFTVRYSDYDQDELEVAASGGPEIVATHFDNRSIVFRGELKRPVGRIESRLGVWGNIRDYAAAGEEALAPETRQNSYAAFSYNEFHPSDRLSLLFGARVERTDYDAGMRPELEEHGHEEEEHEEHEPPAVMDRDFLSASGSVGARFELTDRDALVATVSRSTRAPALEELYNFGPHVGNLAFEIGNPNLDPENSFGLDLSLRRRSDEFAGSIGFFRYDVSDYIFGAATGEMEGGLQVLDFLQADAVYQGFEFDGELAIGPAELSATASFVDAKLGNTDEYLPRIPPLGGQVKLDVPVGRLRFAPRLRWAAEMDRLYEGETATDGYAVFDFTASYVFVTNHTTSNISFRAYNITDAEYRYHTSLIKDLAPQMGRGFRISYSLRFF